MLVIVFDDYLYYCVERVDTRTLSNVRGETCDGWLSCDIVLV